MANIVDTRTYAEVVASKRGKFRTPSVPADPYYLNHEYAIREEAVDDAGRISRRGRRWIRLLILLPGRLKDPITCERHTVFLDDKPDYEALSYSWGSVLLSKIITLDGHAITITKNLWHAMRRLRRRTERRAVWIDFLCIDQANDVEKTEQVQMMKYIFSKAKGVCIWLGECPDYGRSTGLSSSLSHDEPLAETSIHDCLERCLLTPVDLFTDLQGCQSDEALWWNRMWVVQELLAACLISVAFGPYVITWPAALKLFGNLWGLEDLRATYRADRSGYMPESNVAFAHPWFWSLLLETREKKSTDPRDKVYGLLGLMPSAVDLPITPDYTAPVRSVFAKATGHCISSTGTLDVIFSYWKRLLLAHGFPSWIIDFTKVRVYRRDSWDHEIDGPYIARPEAEFWSIEKEEIYRPEARGLVPVQTLAEQIRINRPKEMFGTPGLPILQPFRTRLEKALGYTPEASLLEDEEGLSHLSVAGWAEDEVAKLFTLGQDLLASESTTSESPTLPVVAQIAHLSKGCNAATKSERTSKATVLLACFLHIAASAYEFLNFGPAHPSRNPQSIIFGDFDPQIEWEDETFNGLNGSWARHLSHGSATLDCFFCAHTDEFRAFLRDVDNAFKVLEEFPSPHREHVGSWDVHGAAWRSSEDGVLSYLERTLKTLEVSVREKTWNGGFFITEKGYLGIGTSDTRIGDSVVKFLGASAPWVLRKSAKGRFRLLGDAFVFGMMNQEFEKLAKEGRMQKQEYVLE